MWPILLILGVSGEMRTSADPCVRLMRGQASMQEACIRSEVALLADKERRQRAVSMLVGIGKASVPWLVEALGHDNAKVRAGAAEGLGRIRIVASSAGESWDEQPVRDSVWALSQALKDRVPEVRQRAAEALARMGASALGARAAIEGAQSDPDAIVRQWANVALTNLRASGRNVP